MAFEIKHGDCLEVMRGMADNSVDAIVTDPPYGLSFMGKKWDYDVPSVEVWEECLRVLKPGGHLLAFAGTRTQHRMAVRIEDAGFEIRDMIAWVYGSGFPKSLDVSKAIDKMDATHERRARALRFTTWMRSTGITARQVDEATGTNMGGHYLTAESQPAVATVAHLDALRPLLPEVPEWVEEMARQRTVESQTFASREVVGVQQGAMAGWSMDGATRFVDRNITAPATPEAQQWQGWGTALKPALEPITVARKPFTGTVAANVLEHGTGAINVDGCRVGTDGATKRGGQAEYPKNEDGTEDRSGSWARVGHSIEPLNLGRWPANLIHDGSEEVVALFPDVKAGVAVRSNSGGNTFGGDNPKPPMDDMSYGDKGSAARFFYCAKASKSDRGESNGHPTVKPTELMRYLVRLVTQPGGTVLDPFTGSGSTGKAAVLEGFEFIGIEREAEYVAIAEARIMEAQRQLGLFA